MTIPDDATRETTKDDDRDDRSDGPSALSALDHVLEALDDLDRRLEGLPPNHLTTLVETTRSIAWVVRALCNRIDDRTGDPARDASSSPPGSTPREPPRFAGCPVREAAAALQAACDLLARIRSVRSSPPGYSYFLRDSEEDMRTIESWIDDYFLWASGASSDGPKARLEASSSAQIERGVDVEGAAPRGTGAGTERERPAVTRALAEAIAQRAMADRGLEPAIPPEWVLDAMFDATMRTSQSAAEPLERALRRAKELDVETGRLSKRVEAYEAAALREADVVARLRSRNLELETRVERVEREVRSPVDADGRTFEQLNAWLDRLRRDLAEHRDACADQALQITELRRERRAREDADHD